MKKILIRGGNLINKGAEAMLLTCVDRIKLIYPTVEFFVFPLKMERGMYKKLGVYEIDYISERRFIIKTFLKYLCKRPFAYIKHKKVNTVNQIIICKDFDGVIDISGFNYGDYWGIDNMLHAVIWMNYFNSDHGKFYILMPQAFGTFNDLRFKKLLPKFISSSSLVYARDEKSYNEINYHFKTIPSNVFHTSDIVFGFNQKNLADKENIGLKIGVTPNMHLKLKLEKQGINYIEVLAKEIDQLSKSYKNISFSLIPTEIYPTGTVFDDGQLCKEILKKCAYNNVIAYSKYVDAKTTFQLIGECDIIIGSRFHSIVFALSQEIPVISIGWSHKYTELMKEFSLSEFNLSPDKLGSSELVELINKILVNKGIYIDAIVKHRKYISMENEGLFSQIKELLENE